MKINGLLVAETSMKLTNKVVWFNYSEFVRIFYIKKGSYRCVT